MEQTNLNMAGATDALAALRASLASEKEWRNIQTTVRCAAERVVAALEAQMQRMDAAEARLQGLEELRAADLGEADARCERLREDTERSIIQGIERHRAQTVEEVRCHVDAQIAAQAATAERQIVESCRRAAQAEWRATSQQLRDEVARCVEEALARQENQRPMKARDDEKLEAVDRQIARLDLQLRHATSEFKDQFSAWKKDITANLASRIGHNEASDLFDAKLRSCMASSQYATMADAEALIRQMHKHEERNTEKTASAEIAQLKRHMHELLGIVETLQHEQAVLKSALKSEAAQSLEQQQDEAKRAVLKLHEAVRGMRRSVESVAKRSELEALSEQLSAMRRQLRSELYQARYIWKAGRPTAKQTIAWNTQAVNTNADVFVWQNSPARADVVSAMVPGLYHVQAAFFTSFSPTLQVLVNGEPALIVTPGVADVAVDIRGDQAGAPCGMPSWRRLRHSAGDIVGVEINAFLTLPARAGIAISYDIDENAQGFLNVRKL